MSEGRSSALGHTHRKGREIMAFTDATQLNGVGGSTGVVGPMPTFEAFKANLIQRFNADINAMRGVLANPKDDPDIRGSLQKKRQAQTVMCEFEKMLTSLGGKIDQSVTPSLFPRPDGSLGVPVAMYGLVFTTAIQRLITMCNQELESIKFWIANAPNVSAAQKKQLAKEEGMLNGAIRRLNALHSNVVVRNTRGWKNDPAQPLA
jgi:hypothetical protein